MAETRESGDAPANNTTGADKALRLFRGRPMIEHLIERVAPHCDALLISANRNLASYRALGHPVLGDAEPAAFHGPLAGVVTALRHMVRSTPQAWLLTLPCDTPNFPPELPRALLHAALSQDRRAAVAHSSTGLHPVFAVLHGSTLPVLEAAMAAGQRRLRAAYAPLHFATVSFDSRQDVQGEAESDRFDNLNTPQEWARAECG